MHSKIDFIINDENRISKYKYKIFDTYLYNYLSSVYSASVVQLFTQHNRSNTFAISTRVFLLLARVAMIDVSAWNEVVANEITLQNEPD